MRVALEPQEQRLFRATGDSCLVAIVFLAAILPLGPAPTYQDSLAGASGSGGGGTAAEVGGTMAPPIGVVEPETPLLPTGVPGPQRAR